MTRRCASWWRAAASPASSAQPAGSSRSAFEHNSRSAMATSSRACPWPGSALGAHPRRRCGRVRLRCQARGGTTRRGRRLSPALTQSRDQVGRRVVGQGADTVGPGVVEGGVEHGQGGLELFALFVRNCHRLLAMLLILGDRGEALPQLFFGGGHPRQALLGQVDAGLNRRDLLVVFTSPPTAPAGVKGGPCTSSACSACCRALRTSASCRSASSCSVARSTGMLASRRRRSPAVVARAWRSLSTP